MEPNQVSQTKPDSTISPRAKTSAKDLIKFATKEFSTTLRVLSAYPKNKDDFKPHDRSSVALKLASTFVFEMYLAKTYLFGDALDQNKFKDYAPGNIENVIKDFVVETEEVIRRLGSAHEEVLSKSIEFGGAIFKGDEFMLMMICDQIHHRGQLTVYVRLAGGLVPSIYGPSADDPSTNL